MTTKRTLMTTVCFASLCAAMYGQTSEKTTSFQYFVTNDATRGNVSFKMESIGKTVVGKPFSATEERQTVQLLGDGTRIDNKETDKYYRDAQGRTRIERDNGATIVISDPVAGFTAEMSATNKTARKMTVQVRTNGEGGTAPNIIVMDKLKAEIAARRPVGNPGEMTYNRTEVHVTTGPEAKLKEAQGAAPEDLGTQIVNGVPAQGSRSIITIPAGQIGNDREIKVASERWFSTDLQMLVKSSNNDPRFGETTYQLTNVLQGAQDPTLFSIPSDFSVSGLR